MGMADRIKERRIAMNYTQEELAQKLGLQKSAIAKYENGRVENIKRSVIARMAEILGCSPAYLMGWDTNVGPILNGMKQKKTGVTINVLGRVAAGTPIEAIEDVIDTEEITEEMAATGEFFGLQINGDSMEPKMSKGDVVIVRQQDDAESGDTVIVTVNGTDATCKRLRKYRDGIELISTNPSYEPMFFSNEDIVNKPVKIIGKVVELRCKF
ncbi:helix-turn-helix domain-containing protein [[Clostridium] symbiosum]|uniref:LexA family protein n=1 Tax=Clostridium symbiosum TaxID=1512 RepID=UPI001FB59ECF|nr:XRE family transcriptional regulator [[Clostridium] symbiosum]MBO1696325.1 helix-turn-helix domain-containing protein [[Clostridium] symbiosum]